MLSVLAGLMHIIAFVIYHKQILLGISKPNLATWTLWVFISTTNCISYIFMTGDVVKAFISIASTGALIWVFLKAAAKEKFYGYEELWDKVAFWIGIASIVIWLKYSSATYANLIMQFSIIASFAPTFRGVWKSPETEKKLTPWFIWAFGYLFTLSVVFLRWEDRYQDLVYPINCFILHFLVGILALAKNPERRF